MSEDWLPDLDPLDTADTKIDKLKGELDAAKERIAQLEGENGALKSRLGLGGVS